MDIRKVKKLMEMLEESSLGEMEIVEGEESIRLSKSSSATPQTLNANFYLSCQSCTTQLL